MSLFDQRVRKEIKFGRSDVQMWPIAPAAAAAARAAIHTRFVITPMIRRPQIAHLRTPEGCLSLVVMAVKYTPISHFQKWSYFDTYM